MCLSYIQDCYNFTTLNAPPHQNIFTLNQTTLTDVLKYSWVYAWTVPAVVRSIEQLGTRITQSERGILFITYVKDKDFARKGLNPRTELRSLKSLNTKRHYQINLTIYPISHPFSNYEFFQLMSYMPSARPFLQLEFRNNKIGIRYLQSNKELGIFPIESIQRQKYKFTIEVKLPHVIVFMNGREVWKHKYSYVAFSEMWYQWGVYLNKAPKVDQSVLYEDFKIDMY